MSSRIAKSPDPTKPNRRKSRRKTQNFANIGIDGPVRGKRGRG